MCQSVARYFVCFAIAKFSRYNRAVAGIVVRVRRNKFKVFHTSIVWFGDHFDIQIFRFEHIIGLIRRDMKGVFPIGGIGKVYQNAVGTRETREGINMVVCDIFA